MKKAILVLTAVLFVSLLNIKAQTWYKFENGTFLQEASKKSTGGIKVYFNKAKKTIKITSTGGIRIVMDVDKVKNGDGYSTFFGNLLSFSISGEKFYPKVKQCNLVFHTKSKKVSLDFAGGCNIISKRMVDSSSGVH